ncbi:class I SAM-dependent methyltransferase [Mesobacillus jeotgali]|jgi:phosphatidylethanolamine/phosphatidyl-N-methylethanolamine N-methyltransferase|uniref:class I SAM-dependent methyltransferase n=1 Tax=Mesobacillus jeotgali TaxID=129985 RepID=UPI001784C61C|nr:class I SAM-dependent methyltransferase [Mesobacillus jeotgali]UYZ23283.1 class I SAM-dependent methyltransferase [Mesobacillus jeotgali]
MNNSWNRVIYKIWSPIYDKIFNSGVFLNARRQIFLDIPFHSNQKVLFVGVGTGADLELITQSDLDITAIDFSPDMLKKASAKFKNSPIKFLEMDAQNMEFDNETFDYVVASLILSVVPDADKCLTEMTRVLRKGGKIIIFDKFVSEEHKLSFSKKLLRPLIKVLGTDIGLNFEDLYRRNNINLMINEDKNVMMNGMYRKIIISKVS